MSGGNLQYGGMGYSIDRRLISSFEGSNRKSVAPFFVKRMLTESRLKEADPAQGVALFNSPPTHPIHVMMMNENLTADISGKFRHAFGHDLTPFRAGGSEFPLYVGQRPTVAPGKDELSLEFVTDLQKSNVPLQHQGDGMRSFAAVLLSVLAGGNHSIQLLDEPEAFLHPPQARLLGRYIAERRQAHSQLFIATHSTDILEGIIEGGLDKVRIIRLRRDGTTNRTKELSKIQTKGVAKDTLARFSRVFDGIFFEHVVVCEADADCMFYQSILNLPSISGERRPDVLFVHTAGKHRMAKLVETLRALDVPVSTIADIDVLREESTMKELVEKLGGRWSDLRGHWKAVHGALVAQRPPLNAGQIVSMIENEIKGLSGTQDFPEDKERAIKRIFKSASPWSAIKQGGRGALPGGEVTKQFDQLSDKCAALGLWIVPVGEIEGFCRSIGSHGPSFVERVLEARELEQDAELADARAFVSQIWRRASQG